MDLKESVCSTTSSMTITPSRKSASFKQETSGRFMETIYKQGKGNHHRYRHFEINEIESAATNNDKGLT